MKRFLSSLQPLLRVRVSKGGSAAILAFALIVCLGALTRVEATCNITALAGDRVHVNMQPAPIWTPHSDGNCTGIWYPDTCAQDYNPYYTFSCCDTDCQHHRNWECPYSGSWPFGSCNATLMTFTDDVKWFTLTYGNVNCAHN